MGFAAGAELDLMSFLAAKYFGLRHYSKIYSWLYAALAMASGIAPSLFALVYDKTGGYTIGFMYCVLCFSTSSLLLLFLGRYSRDFEKS